MQNTTKWILLPRRRVMHSITNLWHK